ncbi:MAG: hypothetical protein U1A77_13055 [Pirellulales bacterium]
MTSSSHRPTALRESWKRPDSAGPQGKRARLGRRWLSLLITAGCIATFGYLLFSPFWHPTTRLLELSSVGYDPFFVPPLEFVSEDAAAVKAPLSKSLLIPGQKPLVSSHTLRSPDDVQRMLGELDALPATPSDVILVYVAAHGIVRDGQAQLVCQNYSPANAEQALVPLSNLLQRLRQSPAGVKLLILDHGRIDFDPRLGILVNEFPELLRSEVAALRDSSGQPDSTVWVLAAHSALERSHVDFVRRKSEFGGAVGRALEGNADVNNDQLLTLAELADFVRGEVSRRVLEATDGREEQTPQLLAPAAPNAAKPTAVRILSVPAKKIDVAALESTATALSPDAAAAAKKARDAKVAGEAKADSLRDSIPKGEEPAALSAASADDATQNDSATASNESAAAATESAGSGAATPDARPPAFPDRAASLSDIVSYGWWKSAETEASALARNFDARSPRIVDAPAAWNAWKARLLSRESLARFSSDADRAGLAIAARQDLASLYEPSQAASRPLPDWSVTRLVQIPNWEAANEAAIPLATFSQRGSRRSTRLPEPVVTLIEKLDQLTANPDDDPKPFQTWWRGGPWPKEADAYVDLRTWQRLATTPETPWSLLKMAWRVGRDGEALAADPRVAAAWMRSRVADADAWRRLGERELLARMGQDWPKRAETALAEADRRYRALADELNVYHTCAALRIACLLQSPEFARWRHLSAGDPELSIATADLLSYYDLLSELSREVESDQPQLERLIDFSERLTTLERRLREPFTEARVDRWLARTERPAERSQRIETMLRTTLLEPTVRSLLLSAARATGEIIQTPSPDSLDRASMPPSAPDAKILNASSWNDAREDLLVSRRLAKLAELPPADDAGAGEALEEVWNKWFDNQGMPRRMDGNRELETDDFWRAYRNYGVALAEFHEGLATRIAASTRRYENLTDASVRRQALVALEASRRAECLLDPRDAERLGAASPAELLHRAAAHDVLAWQYARCLAAVEDAPPDDRTRWIESAIRCGAAANKIPLQPPVPQVAERIVAWDGPTSLSLTGEPTREVTLTLSLRGREAKRVWLVLDYDPESFEVKGPGGVPLLNESEVRRETPAGSVPYPARPDLLRQPASFDLAPASPQRVTLLLKRRPSTNSRTMLIAKAVCDGQVIRHEVAIALPATDALALTPVGPPDSWTSQADGVVLHPLPGHPSSYRFQMVNRGVTDRVISVEFLAPQERIPGENPEEFLGLPIDEILAKAKPGPPLLRIAKLALPANGEPIDLPGAALPMPTAESPAGKDSSVQPTGDNAAGKQDAAAKPESKPDDQPAAGPAERAVKPDNPPSAKDARSSRGQRVRNRSIESSSENANGGAADEPAGAGATSGTGKPRGVDVRHGLLMVIRDLESGAVSARRIQFRPQRPRRYLIAEAEYDAIAERLSIRVRPRDPRLTPDRGYRVSAEFPETLPPGTEAQLEGVVNAPGYEATLYAAIPTEVQRMVTVHLRVDDYPRAFSWRIDCGRTATKISPATDMLGVRITSPAAGASYRAPTETIAVEFEVDAPWGAFESARDFVEIGMDRRRDRELLDDPAVKLYADRQADVWLEGWGPDGVMTLSSVVHDFKVTVPATGLRNLQADLLAQARIGERTQWSEPVGVVFDAAPPLVENVELTPDRIVAQMAELQVVVSVSDEERSGVAKVEVGFDRENRGEFGSGPAIPAMSMGSGRWTAKLPVDLPTPGPTRLLIRATDKVGNASDYTKVPLTVVTKMEVEELAKNQFNRVAGVVLFSKQPVANAKLEIRDERMMVVANSSSDEMGRFVFPRVKAGKYKLMVRGVSRNRSREKEVELVVPPPPAQPVRMEVQLSM